jgi:hypothetical protein
LEKIGLALQHFLFVYEFVSNTFSCGVGIHGFSQQNL